VGPFDEAHAMDQPPQKSAPLVSTKEAADLRPGSSGHPYRIETIQNSLIVMPVDTASSIEAGYCSAGMHPFPLQTKPNGVIRQ
jgi:hypothetical protein